MDKFTTRLKTEISHLHRLNSKAKHLLLSITLYNLISPILGIFTNAFLWRQSGEFATVAFYNLLFYIGIPLGFYLNGFLLRFLNASMLYIVGLFLETLTVSSLIFLGKIDFVSLFIFGLLYGISAGIYWANRNAITLKATQSDNRIYFSSLESNSGTITSILIPVCIGRFLTYGTTTKLYTPLTGYKLLSVVALISAAAITLVMKKIVVKLTPLQHFRLKQPSQNWKRFRLIEFILGLIGGATSFTPVLMVLTLVGKEDALGSIQSAATILASIVVYIIGKRLHIRHRVLLLEISFLFGIIGAGAFSLFYSSIGVFLFFAGQAISSPFIWIAMNSLNYDLIDKANEDEHYAYVCDQELALNAGRVVSILCFFLLITFVSGTFALRFTPLLFTFAQIILLIITRKIEKAHHSVVYPNT